MTYYAATLDMPSSITHDPRGSSATATSVEREVRKTLARWPRFEQLVLEIENLLEPEQEQLDAEPVDNDTVVAAVAFAELLPRSLPAPEIAADPDGEISFDWLGVPGKIFSVSVSKDGRIAYAGRFGDKSKIHGTEQLSEILPQEIVRGIQKAIR